MQSIQKIDYKLFDSIINGELRPFLKKFDSEDYIRSLFKNKGIIEFKPGFDKLEVLNDAISKSNLLKNAQDGDEFILNIDAEKKKIDIEPVNYDNTEYINIDIVPVPAIPPPPDLKAEFFQDIIETEFNKIKIQATKFLEKAEGEKQINFFVNKNIHIIKRLAREAHDLSKKLNHNDNDWIRDSNSNIIYTLKLYLIEIILFWQTLFVSFLHFDLATERDLLVELYEVVPIQTALLNYRKRFEDLVYGDLITESKQFNSKFDKNIEYVKRNVTTQDWYYTAIQNFKDKAYIGLAHLPFLMALDKKYANKNLLINILKTHTPILSNYHYYMERINNFISRVVLWRAFFFHFRARKYLNLTTRKYKFGHPNHEIFIELFCLEEKTNKLISLKSLSAQDEKKSLLKRRSNYIKINDLKKLFYRLGLELPVFLEMREDIYIDQLEPSEIELSKNEFYWNPLKAITLISGYSYNSLWDILFLNQRFQLPDKITKLYDKCVDGFRKKKFEVSSSRILLSGDSTKVEIFKNYCSDFFISDAESKKEYIIIFNRKSFIEWVKKINNIKIPSGYKKEVRLISLHTSSSSKDIINQKKINNKSVLQEYSFIFKGDFWKVRFNDEEASMKNLERLRYIIHLLDNPNRNFYPIELIQLVKGNQIKSDPNYSKMSKDQIKKEGMSIVTSSTNKILSKDKKKYEDAAYSVWEEFLKVKQDGDIEVIEKTQGKWEKVKKAYNQDGIIISIINNERLAFSYKSRLDSDFEKARANVTKQINMAIKDLKKKKMPSFSEYLRKYIKTGNQYSYNRPEESEINWIIK